MKDKLINDVLQELTNDLSVSQMRHVKLVMTFVLKKYDVTESKHELVIYDETADISAYKQYFVPCQLAGLSKKTIELYMYTINRFMRYVRKPFKDIDTNDIRLYLANRELTDKISKATLGRERGCICRFFRWLHEEGYIDQNVGARVEKVKIPKRLKKAFTNIEIELLRNATVTAKEKLIVELLLSTGCRVSELCSLQLSNYNQQHGSITVIGKGNKERTVYVNEKAQVALVNYLAQTGHQVGPLILGRFNGAMTTSGVQKLINKVAERAGVTGAHPHKFRRTAATLAVEHGMDLNLVRLFLGHAEINTTIQYVDTSSVDLKVVHEKYLS